MSRRARPVVLVAWLFIAAGVVGFTYHAIGSYEDGRIDGEALWVLVLRLIAIVAGAFILRGASWARWVAVAWIGYHVVLSAFHSVSELVTHAALAVVIAFVLFRERGV